MKKKYNIIKLYHVYEVKTYKDFDKKEDERQC